MIQKALPIALALLLTLSLPSCSGSENPQATSVPSVAETNEASIPASPSQRGNSRPEGTPKEDACQAGQDVAKLLPESPPLHTSGDREGSLTCIYTNGQAGGPAAAVLGFYSTSEIRTADEICGPFVHSVEPISVSWVDSRGWKALRATQSSGEVVLSVTVCTEHGFYKADLSNIQDPSEQSAVRLLEAMLV